MVRCHINHGLIAVQQISKSAVQRLPGGRAPFAMPKPLTGSEGASPFPSEDGSGDALDSPADSGSGCGESGFGAGAAGAAVLAPGRRAPGAIPRPLTSGSGFAGSAGVSGSA